MQAEGEPQPIGEVLAGIEIRTFSDEFTPMEAFVLVKGMGAKGHVSWGWRATDGMSAEELIGALVVQVELQRDSLIEFIESSDEED